MGGGRFSSRRERWLLTLVVLGLYVACAGPGTFGAHEFEHYAALAEGYRSGQLHLAVEADPRLRELEDPHDPEARRGIPYLWDASYYDGRYYLYFTPLPALVAYLPFRLAFGFYPPGRLVAAAFAFAAWCLSFAALRRLLPAEWQSGSRQALVAFVLAFGSFVPSQLQQGHVWVVAILCGNVLSAGCLYGCVRTWQDPARLRYLALASLAFGLGLHVRLSLAPMLLMLVAVAAKALFAGGIPLKRLVAAALLPAALVLTLSSIHNELRFGSPFDTGHRYQMQEGKRTDYTFCHPMDAQTVRYLAHNVPQYLLAPPGVHRSFPYLSYPRARIPPEDMAVLKFPPQEIAGVFTFFPYVLAGLIALAAPGRSSAARSALALARVVAVAGLASLAVVSTCGWAIARYELDFFWALSAAALVGLAWFTADAARLPALAYALLGGGLLVGLLLAFVPVS